MQGYQHLHLVFEDKRQQWRLPIFAALEHHAQNQRTGLNDGAFDYGEKNQEGKAQPDSDQFEVEKGHHAARISATAAWRATAARRISRRSMRFISPLSVSWSYPRRCSIPCTSSLRTSLSGETLQRCAWIQAISGEITISPSNGGPSDDSSRKRKLRTSVGYGLSRYL